MNTSLEQIRQMILDEVSPSKIVIFGEKKNGDDVREVSLLIVVKDDPKDVERKLYRALDLEFAYNLLVYKEEDFLLLIEDRTSYAYSIMSKGRVLYG